MTRRPSPAMLVALLALFIAVGGGQAVAAKVSKLINGSQIKPSTITSKQVKDGSLLGKDFKAGEIPSGAKGAQGDPGPQGPAGPAGPKGDTGSVDTSNFYTKAEADGKYLGKTSKAVDSSLFDGQNASTFTRGFSTSVGGNQISVSGGTGTTTALAIPGVGQFDLTCAAGPVTTVAYTNTEGLMSSQPVESTVVGSGFTTVSGNTVLANGQSTTILNAENGNPGIRHLSVVIVSGLNSVVTSVSMHVVNKAEATNLCRAAGTYVQQAGIGSF